MFGTIQGKKKCNPIWSLLFFHGETQLRNWPLDVVVHQIELGSYLLLAAIFIVALLVTRFSRVSRYHGVEHQTIGAYRKYGVISREQILAAPRVSRGCGSNLIVLEFLCLSLLSFLSLPLFLKLVISFSVGYELFLLDERGKWGWALSPFYRVSGWLQYWFLTSTPTDRELEVAECAFLALLEADAKNCLGSEQEATV